MSSFSLHYDTVSVAKTGGVNTTYHCRETRSSLKEETLHQLLKDYDVEWRVEWYGEFDVGEILTFRNRSEYEEFISINILIRD